MYAQSCLELTGCWQAACLQVFKAGPKHQVAPDSEPPRVPDWVYDERSTPHTRLGPSPLYTPGSSASQRDTPGHDSGTTSMLAVQASSSNTTDGVPPSSPARHATIAAAAGGGSGTRPPPPPALEDPTQPGSSRRRGSAASLPSSSYEYSTKEVAGSSAYGSERSSPHSHLRGILLGSLVRVAAPYSGTCPCAWSLVNMSSAENSTSLPCFLCVPFNVSMPLDWLPIQHCYGYAGGRPLEVGQEVGPEARTRVANMRHA